MSCADIIALEKVLLDVPTEATQEHLKVCPACTERLAVMRVEGTTFRRFVYPHTLEAVVRGVIPSRPRWSLVLMPVALVGALIVLLLVSR